MDIKTALQLMAKAIEANYDQGELEEDELELAEALRVVKKFLGMEG